MSVMNKFSLLSSVNKCSISFKYKNKSQFIGFNGEKNKPKSILIKNNNLHIDILIDPDNMIGKSDKASISDIILF